MLGALFFFGAMRSSQFGPSLMPTAGTASRTQSEAAARQCLEERAGGALTDEEWARARSRLLEFAAILRSWDRAASGPSRGKVEVPCQREP